jgi:intracellular multiplication protein IcmG
MAEDDKNDYGDEYQFSDLDAIEPEPADETTTSSTAEGYRETNPNLRRNAIIAIVVIILAMLAYRFLGPVFTKKPPTDLVPPMSTAQGVTSPETQAVVPPPTQPLSQEMPSVQTQPIQTATSNDIAQMTQRLSVLETNQQTLRAEMDSLNSQLGAINSNINQLTAKISQLNQNFTVLSSKVEQHSREITSIIAVRTKPKVRHVIIKTPPPPTYFIQAIIPGRAWLIAQNGSTITVREGTRVAGYGVIKLIDSKQGKVITSSGRVLRFSQQDS